MGILAHFLSYRWTSVRVLLLLSLVISLNDRMVFGGGERDLLKSLCADKRIELSRASQIKSLVDQLDSLPPSDADENVCSETIRSALVDLNQLLNFDNFNVCTAKKVSEIRDFHLKYNNNKGQTTLPRSLIQFFLGYGLQVSNICKKNMITSLMLDGKELLDEKDFALMDHWTSENSLMATIMNEPSDYDDLVLPKDIMRFFAPNQGLNKGNVSQADQALNGDKLFLQVATSAVVRKIQALCDRRFKPIYEQVILPLVDLSNVGFDYKGEELERELKEMSTNKEIHQWYRIVYLCESLSSIEIVEDPMNADKLVEGADKKMVSIISKEEAEEIRRHRKLPDSHANHEDVTSDVGPKIDYKMDFEIKLGDMIVHPKDTNLWNLIQKFDSRKSELERIRSRVTRKLFTFAKEFIKSGKINIVGNLVTGSRGKGNMNDELVKTIDDFVNQMSGNVETSRPVSGLDGVGGYAKRVYHNAAYHGVSGMRGKAVNALERAGIKSVFWRTFALIIFIIGVCLFISAVSGG